MLLFDGRAKHTIGTGGDARSMGRDESPDQPPQDGGTVLEPIDRILQQWVGAGPATACEPRPAPPPARAEDTYRPSVRPLTPRLTILDDGETLVGETVRLREAVTVIGRTEGEIRLVHDPLVSARHAEIVREGATRPWHWMLRDLGSCNGTFVACDRTVLRPDRLIMLGARRFRFRPAAAAGWPALVETAQPGPAAETPLAGTALTLGRRGHGNQLEFDDPFLAEKHARILRDAQGVWHLEALPSTNGVWVQVAAIRLAAVCRFQVGEQRFLFML